MTTELKFNSLANLYNQDYYLWLETTTKLLQEGNLEALDIVNLLEEIASMGRSEKKSVRSNLKILLMHLLKYKYQPEKRTNSWKYTIREHRGRLKDDFQDSPSLKRYFTEVFNECYQEARNLAADETGLPLNLFPVTSPFTDAETLDADYLPN